MEYSFGFLAPSARYVTWNKGGGGIKAGKREIGRELVYTISLTARSLAGFFANITKIADT